MYGIGSGRVDISDVMAGSPKSHCQSIIPTLVESELSKKFASILSHTFPVVISAIGFG